MQKIAVANLILIPETRTLTNHLGETIILRPLPYNVFMLLLDQKEQSVSRDHLFNECWEGVVVTDQALTNVISGLRRDLVQLAAEGIELKTVSKIGYLLTINDDFLVTEPQRKVSTFLVETDNLTKVEKLVLIHESIFGKSSRISRLITFCLLVAIGGLYWAQGQSSAPHFLMKEHYQHFNINNTDFYLLNKTKESMELDKIQLQLESMDLQECNAEIYIRLYESAYEDDVLSLRGYMLSKKSNRNGNYTLSQFSHQELPSVIVNAVMRAKVICD
ncbi:transcriptional regulator [Aliivibrio finisterrensis]|uniref:Transcriptional regulator n=1 Tax=Aliivibrio finisterrensis TaxID=511998 RepID=A0A4V1Z7X6_9GAMM|nr:MULTISPECIES: winged helix-turn-helix domain-containing protein [Aliivibrio]MDD9173606.1 winged helix-turn-helix domain-containing protein [Aliivibrio sp. S3TY1]MDD9190682.1 winged helix-turn-helix domain-containing protein [Aliivibrio sp. S2TY2]RYU46916.1 transcriptional regulator [Aliivibrio finisterrensis]